MDYVTKDGIIIEGIGQKETEKDKTVARVEQYKTALNKTALKESKK